MTFEIMPSDRVAPEALDAEAAKPYGTLLDTLAADPQAQLHEGATAELSYLPSAGMGTKVGQTYPVAVQELTATHATVQDTEARGKPLTVPIAVVKLPAVGAGVLLLAAGRAGATEVAGGRL